MSKKFTSIFVILILLTAYGCSSTPKIERVESGSITDLSGNWNDTDSRLVAEQMIQDVLSRPWYAKIKNSKKRTPSVVVGSIRNLSHEHINTAVFIADIERELINSGLVDFIASGKAREELRTEREDQDYYASAETRKKLNEEIGADAMLQGNINTIIDAAGDEQVKFYQVDLELLDIENNRKLWVGQKKIKKFITNPSTRY